MKITYFDYDIHINDKIYRYKKKYKLYGRYKQRNYVNTEEYKKEKERYNRWKKFAYVLNGINKDYQNKLKKEKLKNKILKDAILYDTNIIIDYIKNSNEYNKKLLIINLFDETKIDKNGNPIDEISDKLLYIIINNFNEYIPKIQNIDFININETHEIDVRNELIKYIFNIKYRVNILNKLQYNIKVKS